jgi:hypothetical protein
MKLSKAGATVSNLALINFVCFRAPVRLVSEFGDMLEAGSMELCSSLICAAGNTISVSFGRRRSRLES